MSYQLLSKSMPVARKQYRCIWCPEFILKGEKHAHENSKYEGEFQDHRWHLECRNAADKYFRENDDGFDAHTFKRGTTEEAYTP